MPNYITCNIYMNYVFNFDLKKNVATSYFSSCITACKSYTAKIPGKLCLSFFFYSLDYFFSSNFDHVEVSYTFFIFRIFTGSKG